MPNALPTLQTSNMATARTTTPTGATAGQLVDLQATTSGVQVVTIYSVPERTWQSTVALTTTTSTALQATQGAGVRNYLVGLSYQNTSATATLLNVLDGSTVIAQFSAPAAMAVPAVLDFTVPLRGTANTALNVQCGTTAANVLVNAQGYGAL